MNPLTVLRALPVVAVVAMLGGLAEADVRFPLFYLTPHSTPPHLAERVAVVPQPLQGAPLLTNRVSVALDPDSGSDENYEVSQFHTQDALGRFIFGFHSPDQVRMETRNSDGSVRGSYSYVDPFGMTIKMQYWDDGEGFHASGNALPVAYHDPPQYTPEVQAARDEHFRLYQQALQANIASGYTGEETEEDYGFGESEESNEGEREPAEEEQAEEDDGQAAVDRDTVLVGQHPYDTYPKVQFPSSLLGPNAVFEEEEDSVAVENPELSEENAVLTRFWQRRGKSNRVPQVHEEVDDLPIRQPAVKQPQPILPKYSGEAAPKKDGVQGFFYHFQHYIPVSIKMDDPDRQQTGESLSSLAVRAGAIPVAAVHDVQVSPKQRNSISDHQTMPLFTDRVVIDHLRSSGPDRRTGEEEPL